MAATALNIAMTGSIFASPAVCLVARMVVAVGSIFRFDTHQDIRSLPSWTIRSLTSIRSAVLIAFIM